MSVHLIKLCVGIDDVDHLIRVHKTRLQTARAEGQREYLRHVTRNTPRRASEVLAGGSLYWVIRRVVAVRQSIIGFEEVQREDGRPACAIILGHEHIRTVPRRHRAFQGWRYLPVDDAPADIIESGTDAANLPAEMAAELRELGLL